MATSILMALGSCRRMISASVGRARCSQVAGEPCEHRPGWRKGCPFPEGPPGGPERLRSDLIGCGEAQRGHPGGGGQPVHPSIPGHGGAGRREGWAGLTFSVQKFWMSSAFARMCPASCCCCSGVLRTRRRLLRRMMYSFTRCRCMTSMSSWAGEQAGAREPSRQGTRLLPGSLPASKPGVQEGRVPEQRRASVRAPRCMPSRLRMRGLAQAAGSPRPPPHSPAPPHLPETVVQFLELGQPFPHSTDDLLQGLRGGCPAGLRELLKQRLERREDVWPRPAGEGPARRTRSQTHARTHAAQYRGRGTVKDSCGREGKRGSLLTGRKRRQAPSPLPPGRPAATLQQGQPLPAPRPRPPPPSLNK